MYLLVIVILSKSHILIHFEMYVICHWLEFNIIICFTINTVIPVISKQVRAQRFVPHAWFHKQSTTVTKHNLHGFIRIQRQVHLICTNLCLFCSNLSKYGLRGQNEPFFLFFLKNDRKTTLKWYFPWKINKLHVFLSWNHEICI